MKKLPLVEAIAWIIGSTLFFTGGTYSILKNYTKYRHQTRADPTYYLSRIIQTGPQREALNTAYLAQLMQIAADAPINYGAFDISLAARRLCRSPVIKEATVKLIAPDTIYVDYTVRQPLAWLSDFTNVAIDEEGVPFPVTPFFSPKKLPEVYLGSDKLAWNSPIEGKEIELALSILKLISKLDFSLKRLDVSNAFAKSLGRREIVLIVEDKGFSHHLRLSLKNYPQELGNYLELCPKLPPKSHIIDLRIPQLGFIQERSDN